MASEKQRERRHSSIRFLHDISDGWFFRRGRQAVAKSECWTSRRGTCRGGLFRGSAVAGEIDAKAQGLPIAPIDAFESIGRAVSRSRCDGRGRWLPVTWVTTANLQGRARRV